ncbi:MAG: hypothetical protein QG636_111 [Patescibacteria group bacterium]|nr:hypothetical protein [Patescibacteria group bacterium]
MSSVSIVIPAFNEERTLKEVIERVQRATIGNATKEIIVVDNNSTDETYAIASAFAGVRVFREKRPGKGAAVRTGFKHATGDFLLIQDADLEYDPADFPALLEPLFSGRADLVTGVRPRNPKRGLFYKLGNHAITIATNVLYGARVSEYTGGYKLFTKTGVDSVTVRSDGFAYEHELIAKLLKKRFRLVEVPISYAPRDYNEGKKINWRDGFRILFAVIIYRFID